MSGRFHSFHYVLVFPYNRFELKSTMCGNLSSYIFKNTTLTFFYRLKYICHKKYQSFTVVCNVGLLIKNFYPKRFENKPIFQIWYKYWVSQKNVYTVYPHVTKIYNTPARIVLKSRVLLLERWCTSPFYQDVRTYLHKNMKTHGLKEEVQLDIFT